ncbi:MAG: hypothetical protein J6P66_00625 [Bacteroidaceae bacterium]|nr:hypothetical protein [Bacteroidaceae bacterium]
MRKLYCDVSKFTRIEFRKVKKRYFTERNRKYIRIRCGFDIETTRIEDRAYMYHWQMSFEDVVIVGRRWQEYLLLIEHLNKWLSWQNALLIVWIANLGHEFSFLAHRFIWNKVFAVDARTPLRAQADRIEYREALSISGQGGLKNLAKNYTKTQKLVGDLDYDVIRISDPEDPANCTPLTPKELQYCINDVEILSEWADYMFQAYTDKGLEIPLTMTGIVRNEVKRAAGKDIAEIRKRVRMLFPGKDIYNLIMRYLFRGGYTHASAWWIFVVWDNVIGADFTSSYPAVMLHEDGYPMSPFVECDLRCDGKEITDERIRTQCCWFVADFIGIRKTTVHTIESEHKIIKYHNGRFDNGRLRSADYVRVCLTEIDYEIYQNFYEWDQIHIVKAYTAFRGRLPKYLLKPMMQSYQTKVQLKRQKLSETIEYINAKSQVNSYYGMTVTRLNFLEWEFDPDQPDHKQWIPKPTKKSYKQMISKQLLSPFWGIYVTAFARRCLLLGAVKAMDPAPGDANVIYCDTDSVYFDDTPRNRAIILNYNKRIAKLNEELPEEFSDIGCFEWIDTKKTIESPQHYTFKTLGAKRYLKWYTDRDGCHSETTVAGMRKRSLEEKIASSFKPDGECYELHDPIDDHFLGFVSKDKLFDYFSDGLLLETEETHKSRAAYHDSEYSETITDADGRSCVMHECSGAAIVPVEFTVKMEEIYIQLIDIMLKERRMPVWV